jgi:hypothetical protein
MKDRDGRFHTTIFVEIFRFVLQLVLIETTTYEALISDNGSRSKFLKASAFCYFTNLSMPENN